MTDTQQPPPLTGTFKYVFIPSLVSEPISSKEGSKSGGLSHDELSKKAKEYFFEQNGGAERASVLENATPEERKVFAKQIREQYASPSGDSSSGGGGGGASQLAKMDDDALIDVVR